MGVSDKNPSNLYAAQSAGHLVFGRRSSFLERRVPFGILRDAADRQERRSIRKASLPTETRVEYFVRLESGLVVHGGAILDHES